MCGQRPHEKSSRLSRNYAGHCQHEQRSKSVSTDYIKSETNVAMIWTLRSSNGQYGSHTVGNGTSRRTDTQTQISHKRHHQESEKEKASGNQEELTLTSDKWWNANWWNKSWWVVATAVCATGSVHTLSCRTHIFFA